MRAFPAMALLALSLSLQAGFLTPDPDFFQGFWKVIPVEVEPLPATPSQTAAEPSFPEEEMTAIPTAGRTLPWSLGLAAAMAFLAAAWMAAAHCSETLFRARISRALRKCDYAGVKRALRRHGHLPPGTTLSEAARTVAPPTLADRIRDAETQRFHVSD